MTKTIIMDDLRKTDAGGMGSAVGLGAVILVLVVVGIVVWKYSATSLAPSSPQVVTGVKETPLPPEELVRVTPALGHAESTLEFTPEKSSVAVSQRFSLDAVVQPGSNRVSGAELHVRFDPKMVQLEGIQASPAFSLELQAAKIDNAAGTAVIALGTSLNESSVVAEQTVAKFSFLALDSVGTTRVEIVDTSLVSADNEAQNVLKAIKAAQVTISTGD